MMDENNSQSNYPQKERKGIFFPLLLLTAGVLLLLSNFGYLPGGIWGFVEVYWPVILIISGLDGLFSGNGITGSLLIAGFGGLLLAGNLGYITLSAWELIVKGWPLILIGAGLDFIIGRRSAIRTIFSLLLAFMLIAGLVWIAELSIPGSVTEREFQQMYDDQSKLDLNIYRSAGRVNLSSAGSDEFLVDAKLNLTRNEVMEPEVELGESSAFIRLATDKRSFPGASRASNSAEWEIKVHIEPELTLKSVVIVGENSIDIRGLDAENIQCETVLGKTDIYLSEDTDAKYEISGAIGKIIIHVPEGMAVSIDADKAIGATFIPGGYKQDGDWVVSPQFREGKPAIEVDVDLPIGAIQVVEYPAEL